MLWNGDLSYIFMPRTASRSLNAHFSSIWQGPLFGTASPAQLREITQRSAVPTFVRLGRGHENIAKLAEQLYRHGRTIRQMKKIIFVVRNPYDLVYSNYKFLYENNRLEVSEGNIQTFEKFCHNASHPNPENWFKLEGTTPRNIHIVKFENLNEDIARLDREMEFPITELVHLNGSKDKKLSNAAYSESCERLIYEKYRPLFDLGNYTRYEGL